MKGDPLETKKNFEKKSQGAEKTQRGDPIVSSGFVSYDENGVTETGDPLHYLKCAPRLQIQYFSSSVKSVHYAYILWSDEEKKKKTCHCNSRAHFDKMRRLKTELSVEMSICFISEIGAQC